MAKTLTEKYTYPVTTVCSFLDLSSSSYYYSRKEARATVESRPGNGDRAASHLRHTADHPPIASETVRLSGQPQADPAFDAQNGPAQAGKTAQSAHNRQPAPLFTLSEPGQRPGNQPCPTRSGSSDITYMRLQNDFVYLAIILDVFTRAIRGWCLSRTIDQQLTLDALRMALEQP